MNNFLDVSNEIFEPYFRYAERKCSYKSDDANVLLTEELFVAKGVSFGFISQKRANSIYAETFNSLDENDFSFLKNMDNSACGDVSKKSGRTVAVSCAYKSDGTINAHTALGISILRLFSALGTSPFVLHHSVNQVQIGFNAMERDWDWYNGFYWTIYDVYIKANRASMMGYLEKTKKCTLSDSKWDCGQRNIFDLKPFLSDEDIEFFSGSVSYGQIKRWCSENGFTCGKRVVTRTRSL